MKRNNLLKTTRYILLAIVFISALSLPNFILGGEDLDEICQEVLDEGQQGLSKDDYQTLLKTCQSFYEKEITEIQEDLSKTGVEKKTLENKIYTLNKKIKNLNYQIYQSNLIIKDLGIQIEDTEGSIETTSFKIDDSKEKLSNILRTIYEEDQKPIVEILFSEDELSDFFDNIVALEALDSKGKELLQNIKLLKTNLEEQKVSLDEEKEDLEQVVKIQTIQKQESAKTKTEQEYYLGLTEQQYQKQLKEKEETEKKAAEIRTRIFELVGVSNTKAPTFEEAYVLASWAGDITGVRPALLLAVLTQESNIGKNVGQCYLKNTNTGSGLYIKTGTVALRTMSPTQIPTFLQIMKKLNKDPYSTPVSCVMYVDGQPYGWGGAMGPSQFIPKTWALYAPKVEEITGGSADPWNIRDSFLATSVYLKELGGTTNEFQAAMRYFSGSSWQKWEERYGRSVLSIADGYESDIAKIK